MAKKWLVTISGVVLALMFAVGCGRTSPSSETATAQTSTLASATTTPTPQALFLEMTAPGDESVVDTSRIAVSGKTLAEAVISINGLIAEVDYQGLFTGEVILGAGPNVIEVIASDFYGNEKSAVLTVIYTAALPLTVTQPLNETVVIAQPVTVHGSTNIDAVVSVNGKITLVDASGNFSEAVSLAEGPNLIEVLASDFYGNSSSVIVTVIYNPYKR